MFSLYQSTHNYFFSLDFSLYIPAWEVYTGVVHWARLPGASLTVEWSEEKVIKRMQGVASLLGAVMGAVAFSAPERAVLDLRGQPQALPAWVMEVASEGQAAETGLALPSASGLTLRLLRGQAPLRLTLTAEGTSAQPLLLNGYAVTAEGEAEAATLQATQALPFRESVTLDLASADWGRVSLLALLPQEEATLTTLTLAWDTEDLPEAEGDGGGLSAGGQGATEAEGAIVWVEADSPSRDCPASAVRVGETPNPLMPTDHVTLRAAAHLPFASKTFAVEAVAYDAPRTEEGALRFRNNTARVALGQPATLDFAANRPCAISAWIRPEKKDGLRNIVARGYVNAPLKRELFLRFSEGKLQFGWWCQYGQAMASAPYTPALGAWAHVMGVFDGSTYILYVNGEEVARKTSNLRPGSFDADWAIGRHATNGERFFYGDIGEVSFYRGHVAPEAVSILAQSRAQGISEASLRGIWSVGGRLVVLADTVPPALTAPEGKTLPAPQDDLSVATHGTATATDVASETVIVTPMDEGPAFVAQEDGTVRCRLSRHWVAEDASGLESVATQTLDLADTTLPELTLPSDCSVTQRQGIAPTLTGMATATDNSGMAPTVLWRDVADTALNLGLRGKTAETLSLSYGQRTGKLLGDAGLLDVTRPYAIAACVRPLAALRTARGDFTIVSKEHNASREVVFRVENGVYQFGFGNYGTSFASFPVPEEDIGRWVSLVGLYDGRTLQLWRDGELVAQTVPDKRPAAYEGRWAVGCNPAFGDRQFLGDIRHAALWQRTLSEREIQMVSALSEEAFAALTLGPLPETLAQGLAYRTAESFAFTSPSEQGRLLGDATFLDVTQPYAITATVCPDAQLRTARGRDYTIVSKGNAGGNEIIFRVENGCYQFGFGRGSNKYVVSVPIPQEDVGRWVTLTGTLQGVTLTLYREGLRVAQATMGATPAAYEASWAIGHNPAIPGRGFIGGIRDVAFWSRALTEDECRRLGTATREAFERMGEPIEPSPRTVTREWTATDPFANAASGIQTLTVTGALEDPDGDGLCDVFELEVYGTDPDGADTDGDTLADGEEVTLHGTDPCAADTDGDRLPDAWELRYGFDPRVAGETYLDPDGDGLANVSERQAGTDPLVADTDGDGLDDGLEALSAHSDPLKADIDVSAPTQQGDGVDGIAFVGASGTWGTSGGTVYARERSGTLTYRLTVPSPAPQALAVKVEQSSELTEQKTFDLSLRIDGLFIARFPVTAPKGAPTEALFFLPLLEPGEHTFTVAWHNWRANTFVAIHGLRFLDFGGPDADGNGRPDWQDARAERVTTVAPLPETSFVSPVCIEGTDLWRDVLDIRATYPEVDGTGAPAEALVPVTETIGEGFYANVPLAESGEAVTLTLADRRQVHSFPVAWEAFDVTAGLTDEAPFPLRKGDALRLFGGEGGQSVLTIQKATADDDWVAVTNLVASVAVPYAFEEPGLYRVVSEDAMGGGVKGTATVEVAESRFPQAVIAVASGKPRTVECPAFSPRALLEHDAALQLTTAWLDSNHAVADPGPRRLSMSITASLDRPHGMVARLGEHGPVMDAAQVRPIWGDNGGYYRVLKHYADGSQLTEVVLQLGAVPPGLKVKLEIFVAGVTFEDGARVKWLSAEDFDDYGVCRLTFIRGANVKTSVCHRTHIYQGNAFLGVN